MYVEPCCAWASVFQQHAQQQNGAFSFTDSCRVFSSILVGVDWDFWIKLYGIQSKPKFFSKQRSNGKWSKTLSIVKIACWDLFFLSVGKPILTKRFLGCCCCFEARFCFWSFLLLYYAELYVFELCVSNGWYSKAYASKAALKMWIQSRIHFIRFIA